MEIWLQRLSLKVKPEEEYKNELCKLVARNKIDLWNLKWLENGIEEDKNRGKNKNESEDLHLAKILSHIIDSISLVNRETINRMPPVIQSLEVDAFDEYG